MSWYTKIASQITAAERCNKCGKPSFGGVCPYCGHVGWGGANREFQLKSQLEDLLNNPKYKQQLDTLTVVRMARQDIMRGDVKAALYRLRVDSDKIRTIAPELYDFVIRNR